MALDLSDLKIGLEQIRVKAPLIPIPVPLHSTSSLPSIAPSSTSASPEIIPDSSSSTSSSSSTILEGGVNKIQNSHITFLDSEKDTVACNKTIIEAKERVDSFIHATYMPEEGTYNSNCFTTMFCDDLFQLFNSDFSDFSNRLFLPSICRPNGLGK